MKDWFLSKITDYWDSNNGALHANAKILSKLNASELEAAIIDIQRAVTEHVRVLPDHTLLQVACVMVDDLYKSMVEPFILQNPLLVYLQASASTFCKLVKDRGYVIQYIVDNSFSADEVHMMGPLKVFPLVFKSSGFIYICPQDIAIRLMQPDAIEDSNFYTVMPRYIEEARDVSNMAVNRCHKERDHYVYIDTDAEDDSFNIAISQHNQPGVVLVSRCEAATKDSKVQIFFPEAV